ncbi:MAG: hypothetical protein LBF58_04675 [Deltaproteobacteria bacterium]|nr:hypothetical protein [Deltaproteobacteria bacterium]
MPIRYNLGFPSSLDGELPFPGPGAEVPGLPPLRLGGKAGSLPAVALPLGAPFGIATPHKRLLEGAIVPGIRKAGLWPTTARRKAG